VSFSRWLLFAVTEAVLCLTPGPAVLFVVSHGLAGGGPASLWANAGILSGNTLYFVLSALGLGALLAASHDLFTVVQYAGAAYLVYLGIRMWRSTPAVAAVTPKAPPVKPLRRVFRDGFVVAMLNPKTSLFFASFLPQFMDAHASPLVQTLALGGVFIAIAACTDLMYVLTSSLIGPRLGGATRHAVWGNRIAGTSFIGLGVLTAMGSRPTR